MNNPVPNQLSTEATGQFLLGVNLLLSRWTALQMAIQNKWGGRHTRQIAEQFPFDIVSRFSQAREPLYIDEVEEILDELMLSLDTEVDDDSIGQNAKKIMVMHDECLEGNFTSIERLKEAPPARVAAPHIRQGLNDDEEDDSDSSSVEEEEEEEDYMVVDAPAAFLPNRSEKKMVVDEPRPSVIAEEDGWTVVGSKKNKRSKELGFDKKINGCITYSHVSHLHVN